MTAAGPIFVVGAPRSGTTLLRYMLCSHPRIYVPPESNFIPRFFLRHPETQLTRRRALTILTRIQSYKPFWRDWSGEPLEPRSIVDGLEHLTPAALIDALYRTYAERFGAVRWGDKSPIYASHIGLLTTLFPTAKIVHIVRDARDVAASTLASYQGPRFFYVDPYYAARRWKRCVEDASEAGAKLSASSYYLIRYEDLTSDPNVHLGDLCRFLDEAFEPAMATPRSEARRHHHSSGIHERVRQPVTTARAGRWERDLSKRDARLVQRVAGRTLLKLGYAPGNLGRADASELARAGTLRLKYETLEAGRRVLLAAGIFHPTRLLDLGLVATSAIRGFRVTPTGAMEGRRPGSQGPPPPTGGSRSTSLARGRR